jgi:hypothetical protein
MTGALAEEGTTMRERMAREMARSPQFTIRGLANATGATYESANRFIWQLCRSGSVHCESSKRNGHKAGDAVYFAERAPEGCRSVRANGRERAWAAIRILRRFTIAEITATAEVGANNALKYILDLARAGYLHQVAERQAGAKLGGAVYALAVDSGPHAPRVRPDGSIYDTNNEGAKRV